MDANTPYTRPGHEEADCDNVLQTRSGRQYLRIPSATVQPELSDMSKVIDGPAGRASKNTFPFLLLPGELRNSIYSWSLRPGYWHPEILHRQPPITRVSRQLRHEALGLFFSCLDVCVGLPEIPDGDDDSTCQRQDPSSFISEMLDVFTPKPESTLQASTLCYLSDITLVFFSEMVWPETSSMIISMSNKKDKEYHCLYPENRALRTAGLNWNDEVAVSEAFLEAARSGEEIQTAAMLVRDDGVTERAEGAASQVARVLCLMAQHCPQLTTLVAVAVDLEDYLQDRVEIYYRTGSDIGDESESESESD